MTKNEFKNRLSKLTSLSPSQVSKLLDAISTLILDAMIREDRIIWSGLGTFSSKIVKPRSVQPPGQAMKITLPAHIEARFKVSKNFKTSLKKASESPKMLERIAEIMAGQGIITDTVVSEIAQIEAQKAADDLVDSAFNAEAEVIAEPPVSEDLEPIEPVEIEPEIEQEPSVETTEPAVAGGAVADDALAVSEPVSPETADEPAEALSPDEAAAMFEKPDDAPSAPVDEKDDVGLSGVADMLGIDSAAFSEAFKIRIEDEKQDRALSDDEKAAQIAKLREQTGRHVKIERPKTGEMPAASDIIRRFNFGPNIMPVIVNPAEGSAFKHEIPMNLDEASYRDAVNKLLMSCQMKIGSIVLNKKNEPAIAYDVERTLENNKAFINIKLVRVKSVDDDEYSFEIVNFDHHEYRPLVDLMGLIPKTAEVAGLDMPVKTREVQARLAVKRLHEDMG